MKEPRTPHSADSAKRTQGRSSGTNGTNSRPDSDSGLGDERGRAGTGGGDKRASAVQEGRRATIQATIAKPASRPEPELIAPEGAGNSAPDEPAGRAGSGVATVIASAAAALTTDRTGCGMTDWPSAVAVMSTA